RRLLKIESGSRPSMTFSRLKSVRVGQSIKPWQTVFMNQPEFFKIRVGSLLPNRPIPFDVHILLNQKYVHYLRAGDHLTPEKIAKLDRADVFFIPVDQRQAYKSFIYERMNESELEVAAKA